MASGSLTRQRSVSNRHEAPQIVLSKGKDAATEAPFEPCAATASHFLYAQGSTVVVLHHDTLALERRFQSHTDRIEIISVDNVSERNSGRLVVTYDIGKTAIIWDLFSGQQISRFASFEPLLVAAWMRNGNIAFGNEKGDVILFEPSTSEHISARTIHDPITALAPSSDCKTYALGYRNGSILLAALQPQFTILHTLNTTRSPSPISMLTWHASSSKQKSDMLAIQNADGDLRVWSVPKPPTAGIPRVIRILKRNDTFVQGRNWVSWSKNGRIIQFSEGETWAWDVRTKDVNYVPVPTIEFVRGVAAHGPTAALFTLGPESTVQQYDVESGEMVANIRHMPITVPPTPPEEHVRQFSTPQQDAQSQLRPSRYDGERRSDNGSPNSHTQSAPSRKSEKKPSMPAINEIASPSKTEKSATTFSQGAFNYGQHAMRGQQQPTSPVGTPPPSRLGMLRQGSRLRQEVVMSPMTPSEEVSGVVDLFPFARVRISEGVHRQVQPLDESNATPDDLRKHMLNVVFGWEDDIYALIDDELQRHPVDSVHAVYLTKWLNHGSEAFAELMASTTPDSQLDVMRLALGVIDSRPENKKLGQVFVEKMLGRGEVHTAVAILLAMGDNNDAIEVYVTNNCYLESILLTCLVMPGDWQRQSHLVRKWGEHVVENSQQQLAIRCFACTGVEPTDNWVSPTAQLYNHAFSPMSATSQIPPMMFPRGQPQPPPQQQPEYQNYQSPAYSAPPMLSNPSVARLKGRGFDAATPVALIAPPTPFRQAAAQGTRITPLTGGLKLITSFGPPQTKSFKFPGLKTDDMTPTNTNTTMVTPIAESAISRSALSPGGLGSYRLNNIQSLNNAIARSLPLSAGPGAARNRLPSIGETPQDVESPRYAARNAGRAPLTPADSGSDKEKERIAAARAASTDNQDPRRERSEPALTLLTSARYDPSSTPVQKYESDLEPQTALRPSTNTSWHQSLSRVQEEPSHDRKGSRSKNHGGLSLNVMQVQEEDEEEDERLDPIHHRPGTTDTTGTNFVMSPSVGAADIYRMKSPSISGRSTDQYISSLDQAQYYGRTRSRNSSRPPKEERSDRKQSKHRKQMYSEDTNEVRAISAAKRSPSSPVSMSPEDLRDFSASVESFDSVFYSSANVSAAEQPYGSKSHRRRESSSTVDAGRTRRRSPSNQGTPRRKQSVKGSRKSSPTRETNMSRRGRSQSRKAGAGARSPSSPLPMLPSEEDMEGRSSVDPAFKFVSKNRSRFARSSSRRPERGASTRREPSTDRQRGRQRSSSDHREAETPVASRMSSTGPKEGRRKKRDASEDPYRSERSQYESLDQLDEMAEMIRNNDVGTPRLHPKTKELAQAELEARRLSLARRPSVPAIPMPGKAGNHSKSASEGLLAPQNMTRNHSDTGGLTLSNATYRQDNGHAKTRSQGRAGTPEAMEIRGEPSRPGSDGRNGASDDGYQLPARAYSANTYREESESWAPLEPPPNMPRHPAFDHRVGTSRGNSRSRTRAPSQDGRRGKSTDRGRSHLEANLIEEEQPPPPPPPPAQATEEITEMLISSPDMSYDYYSSNRESVGPMILPELQHLAVPPPPPPPPAAPPKDLRIQTDLAQVASIPLPRSAFPSVGDRSATPEKHHRRQSSRGENQSQGQGQGQFLGKIRGITERMRSTSKPRDNYTRSPNYEDSIMSPYETVTMMPPPLSAINERR